ncbi:hypothetical protein KMZ93_10635 [Bradyrhizobium sediminis]|uniref:SGNH hydrolase-type esterase domain-containing protein n=1 Tax=Bradyrhizobium sediminis TaxID=2840469 RepID=A0A975RZM8_9BRAD|nr:hypothetical protein [Bradyrhizobium sediminis]QWG25291.1 hypothetical protein KMZ93_10635 [Bradyrhizobium sediminis]
MRFWRGPVASGTLQAPQWVRFFGPPDDSGWFPAPNSSSVVTNARTFHLQHNSLGLRDIEFVPDARPTIMFLGDSFVWGLDAEADQRFSDLLRKRVPGHNIVAAGVSGFGTDQEYLLLQRLWPTIRPGASEGAHWTPEGHKLVAERVLGLLSENNIVPAGGRSPE